MKIVFKKLNGYVGECYKGTITIDLTKDANPGMTAIHEFIHFLYPDYKEKQVLKLEKAIWKKLTSKERERIYRELLAKRGNYIAKVIKEKI